MSLADKLQLPAGRPIRVMNAPGGVELGLRSSGSADAVLLFVRDSSELSSWRRPFIDAARGDWLAWLAYPKAGKLGTDLNRDILWERLKADGIRPVRNISINETWSALRFRPTDSALTRGRRRE